MLDYKIIFEEVAANNYLEIGPTEFLISILSKELNIVFVDRNIRLLKLLRTLIAKNYEHKNKGIILYGTNTFHVIWEETSSVSFNNLRSKKIKDVINNLNSFDIEKFKYKDKKTGELVDMDFMDIIPKPEWYDINSDMSKIVKNSLIPDIISIISKVFVLIDLFGVEKIKKKIFFVLDPKYYNLVYFYHLINKQFYQINF